MSAKVPQRTIFTVGQTEPSFLLTEGMGQVRNFLEGRKVCKNTHEDRQEGDIPKGMYDLDMQKT
jgi:hypothetical protein